MSLHEEDNTGTVGVQYRKVPLYINVALVFKFEVVPRGFLFFFLRFFAKYQVFFPIDSPYHIIYRKKMKAKTILMEMEAH